MSAVSANTAPDTIKRDTEKMMFYTLSDLEKHWEGNLEPVKKLAFDADRPIDRINVPESVILDLLHADELMHKA